jgi:uncharacterized protein (UPF0548 family)
VRQTHGVAVLPIDDSALRRLTALELTYREVGRTNASDLPAGFRHIRMSRSLGWGTPVFESAVHRLMTWQMHERSGLTVRASSPDVRTGALVLLGIRRGPLRLTAPCRVVYVLDEVDRRGFAYGTLDGHPESGEEAFSIRLGADHEVTATVTAFSRPASLLARLGGPVTHRVQRRATLAYLDALAG